LQCIACRCSALHVVAVHCISLQCIAVQELNNDLAKFPSFTFIRDVPRAFRGAAGRG
jgi:hypothetical protein